MAGTQLKKKKQRRKRKRYWKTPRMRSLSELLRLLDKFQRRDEEGGFYDSSCLQQYTSKDQFKRSFIQLSFAQLLMGLAETRVFCHACRFDLWFQFQTEVLHDRSPFLNLIDVNICRCLNTCVRKLKGLGQSGILKLYPDDVSKSCNYIILNSDD